MDAASTQQASLTSSNDEKQQRIYARVSSSAVSSLFSLICPSRSSAAAFNITQFQKFLTEYHIPIGKQLSNNMFNEACLLQQQLTHFHLKHKTSSTHSLSSEGTHSLAISHDTFLSLFRPRQQLIQSSSGNTQKRLIYPTSYYKHWRTVLLGSVGRCDDPSALNASSSSLAASPLHSAHNSARITDTPHTSLNNTTSSPSAPARSLDHFSCVSSPHITIERVDPKQHLRQQQLHDKAEKQFFANMKYEQKQLYKVAAENSNKAGTRPSSSSLHAPHISTITFHTKAEFLAHLNRESIKNANCAQEAGNQKSKTSTNLSLLDDLPSSSSPSHSSQTARCDSPSKFSLQPKSARSPLTLLRAKIVGAFEKQRWKNADAPDSPKHSNQLNDSNHSSDSSTVKPHRHALTERLSRPLGALPPSEQRALFDEQCCTRLADDALVQLQHHPQPDPLDVALYPFVPLPPQVPDWLALKHAMGGEKEEKKRQRAAALEREIKERKERQEIERKKRLECLSDTDEKTSSSSSPTSKLDSTTSSPHPQQAFTTNFHLSSPQDERLYASTHLSLVDPPPTTCVSYPPQPKQSANQIVDRDSDATAEICMLDKNDTNLKRILNSRQLNASRKPFISYLKPKSFQKAADVIARSNTAEYDEQQRLATLGFESRASRCHFEQTTDMNGNVVTKFNTLMKPADSPLLKYSYDLLSDSERQYHDAYHRSLLPHDMIQSSDAHDNKSNTSKSNKSHVPPHLRPTTTSLLRTPLRKGLNQSPSPSPSPSPSASSASRTQPLSSTMRPHTSHSFTSSIQLTSSDPSSPSPVSQRSSVSPSGSSPSPSSPSRPHSQRATSRINTANINANHSHDIHARFIRSALPSNGFPFISLHDVIHQEREDQEKLKKEKIARREKHKQEKQLLSSSKAIDQ